MKNKKGCYCYPLESVIHIISQREKRRSHPIDTYCNKAIDVEHKMYYLFNKN